MISPINYNSLHIFSVCAQVLSFRQAADQLNLTQSAVAQRIRQLEDRLGVKLFKRLARGLQMTEAGVSYVKEIDRALGIIANATQRITDQRLEITVSMTPSFASKWFLPRLSEFRSSEAGFDLHIHASTDKVALAVGHIDAAIRLGRPPFGKDLDHELLFVPTLCLVVAPGYLPSTEALSEASLIVDSCCKWEEQVSDVRLQGLKRLRVSQSTMAIDAAINGQGVTVTALEFVEQHLRRGELILLKKFEKNDLCQNPKGFYFVSSKSERPHKGVTIVQQWLRR